MLIKMLIQILWTCCYAWCNCFFNRHPLLTCSSLHWNLMTNTVESGRKVHLPYRYMFFHNHTQHYWNYRWILVGTWDKSAWSFSQVHLERKEFRVMASSASTAACTWGLSVAGSPWQGWLLMCLSSLFPSALVAVSVASKVGGSGKHGGIEEFHLGQG